VYGRRDRSRLAIALLLVLSALAAPTIARAADGKFLLVSDIHFNPMADPALVDELVKAEPGQWEAILDRTSPVSFSQYKSDTNWWLLKSALAQFPKTIRHPALVMVTGDLLAHAYPSLFRSATHDDDQQHYRAFVLKTVQFLALELRRKFPDTKIFLTPGNNDNDCGDYAIEAGGAFLNDTAPVARELAGGDDGFITSWKSLGSFNVPHPTISGTRIVSLNSIFLSQKYQALSSSKGCTPVASTAAADVMKWLEQQLASAAQANQKVWLMFHIPPGIDGYATAMKRQKLLAGGAAESAVTCSQAIVPMWATQWTAQLDTLLEKYHATVVAVFAAHTHSDDFRVMGEFPHLPTAGKYGPPARSQFVLMNPAISPVYQQNPGFRVVSYDKDGRMTDQSTYFLTNLPTATVKAKGQWKREYTFTRQWKTHELNAASLSRVYDEVVADESVRATWLKLYAVSGPAEAGEKPIVRALYCAVEGLTVESYQQCYCGAAK
jgi:sphingomyelin phosphodiesterase acid-like 3